MRKLTALSFSALATASLWAGQTRTAIANNYVISQVDRQQVCHAVGRTVASGRVEECFTPEINRRSLTVIGQGLVTTPADTALLEFRFASRAPIEESESAGLSIQTARQVTEETLKPVINALTNAGVSQRNITIQTSSLQAPKVFAKLEGKPTQEKIQQVVFAVDRSLKSNQQIFLQSIGAGYAVNNCQPLERSARRLALKDAQTQLATLAQDVGVQLGELLSVIVLPLVGSSDSIGCGTKVGIPISPLPITIDEATPPYNPSDKPEVTVRSQVSVTHAIKASNK